MNLSLSELPITLAPSLPGLEVDHMTHEESKITIALRSTAPTAICPLCGKGSTRVRSHYTRSLADLPWSCFAVRLHLQVRRFACTQTNCPRRIFVERLPSVVAPHARRTERQAQIMRAVAFALGGEAGHRLSERLNLTLSASTLLRLIRKTPETQPSPVRILGVDDWALRKGRSYGTLLVDHEQRRPVDLGHGKP